MSGYTRQDTTGAISTGNIIEADDLNAEFDAVEGAFNASSGHKHDGTSAEGAPIEVIGPAQDIVATTSVLRPKTDNTIDLGTSSLKYKDIHSAGTAFLNTLNVTANTTVGGTLGVTGNTTLGGTLGVTGTLTGAAGSFTSLASSGTLSATGNTTIGGTLGVTGAITATGGLSGAITSSNATITGGTINGTTIGATTPSTGAFTTLSASTSLTTPLITRAGTLALSATGANVITASTNGVERMRIASNGNVGIGTSSPSGKLEVKGAQTRIYDNDTYNVAQFGGAFAGQTPILNIQSGGIEGAEDNNFAFATIRNRSRGATAATRRVGVRFALSNEVDAFQSGISADLYIESTAAFAGSPALCFATSNTERLRITSAGNVGIGTSSPSRGPLHINAASGGTEFHMTNAATGTGSSDGLTLFVSDLPVSDVGGAGLFYREAGPLRFGTNNTERMRIDSAGNVGIGLTPTTRNNTRLQIVDGIGFPATQVASTDANTLDDYEEGTFTPSYTPETGAFTELSYTAHHRTGSYTKVGNLVTVNLVIATTVVTVGTASGALFITGLPFVAAQQTAFIRWPVEIAGVTSFATPMFGYVEPNTSRIVLSPENNGRNTVLLVSNLVTGTGSARHRINLTVSYLV